MKRPAAEANTCAGVVPLADTVCWGAAAGRVRLARLTPQPGKVCLAECEESQCDDESPTRAGHPSTHRRPSWWPNTCRPCQDLEFR